MWTGGRFYFKPASDHFPLWIDAHRIRAVLYFDFRPDRLPQSKTAVHEHARVKQAIDALKAGKLTTFGQLMNASHRSLKDDYEVTGIELDTLAEEGQQLEGVLGSRMTGAGLVAVP